MGAVGYQLSAVSLNASELSAAKFILKPVLTFIDFGSFS
jgi:hypothetical protein